MTLVSVLQARHDIMLGRQSALRSAVQSAAMVVSGYQEAARSGAMSEADAQKAAIDAVRMARYGDTAGQADYFYILTTEGVAIMHPHNKKWVPGQTVIGKTINKDGVDTAKLLVDAVAASRDGNAYIASTVAKPGDPSPDPVLYPKLQHLIRVPGWNWIVGSGLYMDDVEQQVWAVALRQTGIGVVVLLAIGGLGYAISRAVLRQLGGEPALAIGIMDSVAHGNLAVEVPPSTSGSLLEGLGHMVQAMRATVEQVRASSDSIDTASREIAAGNLDLSHRTEQTASNLQQAATAMDELTGTVQQSAASAQQANALASSAVSVARRGGEVIGQVVSTMTEINHSSGKIADIIGVIDSIAFQTNILALNAAVEAARAGEQGRGFAVVASEVRSLAQRSAEAAKEIKTLISSSVDSVQAGTRLVDEAGTTMREIVDAVQRVGHIIGEITLASTEQSTGISHVNTAVAQLDQMTQQNSALVEESAAAAESLKEQAQRLSQAVNAFRLGA
ncbi:chemotaxis protein [Pelomonas saccharophila]|nr:chemotaxis protein [Roseateles saccharophilus]